MLPYIPTPVDRLIQVDALYSLHYFSFPAGYVYPGESHDFWELVYVDMGTVSIGDDADRAALSSGQARLHAPNAFHTISANLTRTANVFVISFESDSPILHTLTGSTLTLSTPCRRCVRRMITEGETYLGPVLDVTNQRSLTPADTAQTGAAQYVALNLEMLLLLLVRSRENGQENAPKRAAITDETEAIQIIAAAQEYMQAHLDGSVRMEDLCRACGLGTTTLKKLFRQKMNCGVMEHYRSLRLKEACRQLRTGQTNISQTAAALGYGSLSSFTRQFRAVLGITPSEYTLLVNDSLPPPQS